MQDFFYTFSQKLFALLHSDEAASISFMGEETLFTRFTRARIRQATHVTDGTLTLCLMKQGKRALLTETFSTHVDVASLVKKARAFVDQLPEDPVDTPLSEASTSTHKAVYTCPAAEEILEMFGAYNVDAAGLLTTGSLYRGMASSAGHQHWCQVESYTLDASIYAANERCVKILKGADHWDHNRFKQELSTHREQLSLLERPAISVAPGTYRAYLSPRAMSDFISLLSWQGLGAASFKTGASHLSPFIRGEKQFSEKFSVAEDFSLNVSPRFNTAGELAAEKLSIIDQGCLKNLIVSTRSAKEYDLQSTFATDDTSAFFSFENLRSPRVSTGALDVSDCLKALDTGLYLSDVHYLNWSDPLEARVTGSTRFACFWVEKGKIVAPLPTMRFNISLYDLWGKAAVVDFTKKSFVIPTSDSYAHRQMGGVCTPGLLTTAFTLCL